MASPDPEVAASPVVTIVVTNYNGRGNLETCLPAIARVRDASPDVGQVIVVDDRSEDDSVDWIRARFPWVEIEALDRRTGFQGAANAGFRRAQGRLVLLLSNDMVPDEAVLTSLVVHFDDPATFAVACRLLEPDGSDQSGRTIGTFFGGNLLVLDSAKGYRPLGWLLAPPADQVCPTLYTGGNALYDRARFLDMGGFDDLYHPFYWEDLDLCFRAWKRGYRVLFDPGARVTHARSRGTIRRYYSRSFAQLIRRRNRLLFTWTNLDHPGYWLLHVLASLFQVATAWILLDATFYRSVAGALARIPGVRARRARERPHRKRTDVDVLRETGRGTGPGTGRGRAPGGREERGVGSRSSRG